MVMDGNMVKVVSWYDNEWGYSERLIDMAAFVAMQKAYNREALMKQTIEGLQVDNKTVFVRVDFNVPMKDGVITDDTRFVVHYPTINYLIEKGAKVILASHFGRPKGERKPEMSLAPCAKHLSELINKPVAFVDDCIGPKVEAAVKALQPGDVLMLENLRYHNEETKNDPEFAKQLASLADVAINDAFGVSHRNAASVVGIADYIPMAAGFLLKKEIDALSAAVVHPKHLWQLLSAVLR